MRSGIATLMRVAGIAIALAAGPMGLTVLAAEPVALQASPALAPGLAAFPRLVAAPAGSAAARINAALGRGDGRARKAAADCRAAGGKDGAWSRTVGVTMRGPHYLSLVAVDEWYCGGAHPDTGTTALVYDLDTGAPVNWRRLLPPALVEGTATDTAGDGTVLGKVLSAALRTRYVKAATAQSIDPDCTDVLADPGLGFLLWPDADADGLAVQPAGLPSAVAACGPPIVIPLAELRTLGVDAGLLQAIDEAHRQGWYDKTPK